MANLSISAQLVATLKATGVDFFRLGTLQVVSWPDSTARAGHRGLLLAGDPRRGRVWALCRRQSRWAHALHFDAGLRSWKFNQRFEIADPVLSAARGNADELSRLAR